MSRVPAPRSGDIGEPLRHIEFEPIPTSEPQREPAPAPAPAPAPEREKEVQPA